MTYRNDFIEEDLLNYTDEYLKNEICITRDEYLRYLEGYIIRMSDGYYFSKDVTLNELCNEIIGRYLCEKINLDTTCLEIWSEEDEYYQILTPNYRKRGYFYTKPDDNFEFGQYIETFDDSIFRQLDKKHQNDLLKLMAVDMMMEQEDRYSRNLEEYIVGNNVRLTPVIDFAIAFSNIKNHYTYFNPYILINKSAKTMDSFLNKYPNGYLYFKNIFDTTCDELFEHIEKEYEIKPSNHVKKYINSTIKRNHKVLEKLKG